MRSPKKSGSRNSDPEKSDGVHTLDDWRELAQLIQTETDPHKMVELVQKLITRFDDEKLRKNPQARADSK